MSEQQTLVPKKVKAEKNKQPREEFYLMPEQAAQFPYTEKYLVTELAEKLNELWGDAEARKEANVKSTSGADIFRKIQAREYAGEQYVEGKRKRFVTEEGQKAGLFIGTRTSKKGTEYEDIYYNEAAQHMVVEWFIRDTMA